MFFKWVDPSDTYKDFACLPYISGLTEPLTRLLRKNEIRIVKKPFKTLQQEFPSPKFRQPSHLQSNVVYKIPCKDCSWNYIGETGRCFQTRKKEHQRNLKNYAKGSNVANHAWKNNHTIDFDNACVIDKGNYRVRKTLESWHTAKTFNADNNSKPLPRQYSILLSYPGYSSIFTDTKTIRPFALKGHGSIAHSALPHGLLSRRPFGLRV